MALTFSEEIQLLEDVEGLTPNLSSVVRQAAIGRAVSFKTEAKSLDPITQEVANSYQAKILTLAGRITRSDANALDTMLRVLVALVGDSPFTYAQASGATIADWEDVLNGNQVGGVDVGADITTIMEVTSGALDYERTAWQSA